MENNSFWKMRGKCFELQIVECISAALFLHDDASGSAQCILCYFAVLILVITMPIAC